MKDLRDPADFFRPLQEANPPEEIWVGFWPSVRAGIRESELHPRPLMSPGGALLLGSSAGIMTAAAVLALGFLVMPVLRVSPSSAAYPRAVMPASTHSGEGPTSPPVMEQLGSASARVYTFHVGEKADATDVILIVDESIDI